MAVTVTITKGYRDLGYFDNLNQQSAYPNVAVTPPVVIPAHNQLTGLSGDIPYQHLDAAEYAELGAWLGQIGYNSSLDQIESVTLYGNIYLNNDGDSSGGHEERFIYWGANTYISEVSEDALRIVSNDVLALTLTENLITASVDMSVEASLAITGNLSFDSGPAVDTIETTLTDDDTHIPTSGAVYDAIGGGVGGIDTSDRTIYVETTGDDDTGDGSVGSPFATILRALEDIGIILDPAIITISLGIGTFQYDDDCIVEFGRLKLIGPKGRIYFEGTTQTVESGLTLTEQSGKEWRYDVSGATFTTDEHNENFLDIGGDLYPIAGNGTTTVDSFTGLEAATSITNLQTTIQFADLIFSPDIASGRIRLRELVLDASGLDIGYRLDNVQTIISRCVLKLDSLQTGHLDEGPMLFVSDTLILTDDDTGYGIKSYGILLINRGIIRHDGSGSGVIAYGVTDHLTTSAHSLFIQNYTWGIEVRKQGKFATNDLEGGMGCLIFKDVTNAFGCSNNSHIHCASEVDTTPPWTRTYIDNVDYVLYAREGSPYHGINVHINPLYGTPNTAYLHSIFDDFVNTMPSFNHNIVIDGYNLYTSTYEDTETGARTIYVATTGDDVTGDGSSGDPFATILRAIQDVRNIIDDVTITISIGVGTFSWACTDISIELNKKQLLSSAIILFGGTPVLKDSGFTLAASSDPYIYNVSGTTFTSNEHQDRFLLVSGNYYGIVKNGTTTLNTFVDLAAGVSIYGMDTIIQPDDSVMRWVTNRPNAIARVQIERVTIDASSYNLELLSGNTELRIRDTLIEALKIDIDQMSGQIVFTRTHAKVTSYGITDDTKLQNGVAYKYFSIRKDGATAGDGIKASSGETIFQHTYIENFNYGFFMNVGTYYANVESPRIIIDSCNYGFSVRNGTQIIFPSMTILYIDTVDYLFHSTETTEFGIKAFIPNVVGTPVSGTFDSSITEDSTDPLIDVYWLPFAPGSGAGYWDRSSAGVLSPTTTGDELAIDVVNEDGVGNGVTIEGIQLIDSYFVLSEVSTPGTPAANTGYLYMDDGDEHLYFKTSSVTYDLTEVGGTGGLSWNGSTANGIGTYVDVDTIQSEANLTFDGSVLTLAGTLSLTDTNTQIWEDGSSNLTFKDAVTGTKTLAELAAGGGYWDRSSAGDLSPVTDGDNILMNGGNIYAADGSSSDGDDIGLYGGDADGATNDGGAVIIRGGAAVFADSGSAYGPVTISPGNPYATNIVGQVYIGDSTYNGTAIGIKADGSETNVNLYVAAKGASSNLYLDAGSTVVLSANAQILGNTLSLGAVTADYVTFKAPSGQVSYQNIDMRIEGGNAYPVGDVDGGHVMLYGGDPAGSGTRGQIYFGDGTFGTLQNDETETNVVAYDTTTGLLTYRSVSSIGGGGVSLSGSTNNTVCTVTGADAIQGEASLLFDSTKGQLYIDKDYHGDEGLYVDVDGPDVTGAATNNDRGISVDLRYGYSIDNAITDSGYRMGINVLTATATVDFLGNLDEQFGIRIQYGSLSSSGAGTITDTYGLYLEHNSAGSATLTNVYSIYSTGTATMSHAGNVGISSAPSGSYELYVGGQIYSTGDMHATDFNLASDPIWKDIYDEKVDGLGIALQLNPIMYRWKDRRNDFMHIGFSTKDVCLVRPELVKYDDNGYGMLSYSKITAINTAAIQDLNAKFETVEDRLKSRIFELENRVKELEDGRCT